MKNITYILLLYFATINLYSQNLDYLKKLDTIYIPYYGKENEKKYDIQSRITPTDFKERSYGFTLDSIYLSFYHLQFKGWEKKNANIESEFKKVNKAFLKKVKNMTLIPQLLNQFTRDQIRCEILIDPKVYYILDFTDKKRKIMLYEVIYMGYCPGIE